jgi:hypothetical protein
MLTKETKVEYSGTHSFKMEEKHLRGVFDYICKQLSQKDPKLVNNLSLQVTTKNNYTFNTKDIDDILSLDNSKKTEIREIRFSTSDISYLVNTDLYFSIKKTDDISTTNIHYSLIGDRDWVFLTQTGLEEQLARFSKPVTNYQNIILLVTGIVFTILLISLIISFYPSIANKLGRSPNICNVYYQKELASSDFLNQIQVMREEINPNISACPLDEKFSQLLMTVAIFLISVSAFFYSTIGRKLITQVFYWSENIEIYDRSIKRRNWFFSVIVVALLITILGTWITSKVFQW